MPIDWRDFEGLSPEELRRKYTHDQLRSFRDQIGQQLQTATGAPAVSEGESGVDFLDRAKLGFAVGDEGKTNILRSSGYDPVRMSDGILGTRGKDGVVRPVDEKGTSWGDLADFAGDIPGTAAGIAGGVLGAGAGMGIGSLATGMAGGAAGSALGEEARQKIGQYLGSGEQDDLGKVLEAGAWGAAGEGGGRLLARIGKAAVAPFKGGATQRIGAVEQGARALDQQFGTDVAGKMPLATRTESPILGAIEQRVSTMAPNIDRYQKEIAEPFQDELVKLYDKIGATAGPRSGAQGAGDAVLAAAGETAEKRKGFINQAYDELKARIPEGQPATADNALGAIAQVKEFLGLNDLQGFNVGRGARAKLNSLYADAERVRTFAQLDAFRKKLGNTLSTQESEAFARVGLDKHLANIYGALLKDADELFSRAGALTQEGAERVVSRDVAPMEDLFSQMRSAGKGRQFEERVRGRLTDELTNPANPLPSETADVARRASSLAKSGFEVDRASITNLLRDPDKVANLSQRLTSKTMTGQQVRRFKEKIGALGTEAGLPATEEGKAAWQQIGAEVMANLRRDALNDQLTTTARPVLSSTKLLSALENAGGEDVLTEILGKQTTDDLFSFAQLLRDTGKSERMFRNFSNTGQAVEAENLIGNIAEGPRGMLKAGAGILAKMGLGEAVMTKGGQKYLTQGVMQSPAQQSILKILGRLPAQEFATSRTTQPKRRNK